MAGIEPATLAVLRPRDNHYTTLTTSDTSGKMFKKNKSRNYIAIFSTNYFAIFRGASPSV